MRGQRWSEPYWSRNQAPTHHAGAVLAVHEGDRADVLLFATHEPLEYPRIATIPGLELKRGYWVVVTAFNHDCCVTAVIGHMTEEQITAMQSRKDGS